MATEKYVPSEEEMKNAEEQMTEGQAKNSRARERNLTSEEQPSVKPQTWANSMEAYFGNTLDKEGNSEASYVSGSPWNPSYIQFAYDPKEKILVYNPPDTHSVEVIATKEQATQLLNEAREYREKYLGSKEAAKWAERSLDALEELKKRIESEEIYNVNNLDSKTFVLERLKQHPKAIEEQNQQIENVEKFGRL